MNKLKWSIAKWEGQEVIMYDGYISGLTLDETADKLNELDQLIEENKRLKNALTKSMETLQKSLEVMSTIGRAEL